ncbi:unnamed protein product [Jaminaea pallidilutea]
MTAASLVGQAPGNTRAEVAAMKGEQSEAPTNIEGAATRLDSTRPRTDSLAATWSVWAAASVPTSRPSFRTSARKQRPAIAKMRRWFAARAGGRTRFIRKSSFLFGYHQAKEVDIVDSNFLGPLG